MKHIVLALLLTACGTDPTAGVPTTLTADTKTGEVSLKGEKGDKGDAGTNGANGKDGPKGDSGLDGKNGINGKDGLAGAKGDTGAAGKDGAPTPFGIWLDAVTGRQWLYIEGQFTADQTIGLCSPWKLPNTQDLVPAIQHGLITGKPVTHGTILERAWVSETDTNGDQRSMVIVNPNPLNWGIFAFSTRDNLFRVYCVKE